MFRKSLGCWLLSLLLGPTCALALEIGEIQVSSSLNQLFDARIPLPKLTPEELNKVSVKLAPPSMYKEFGLDRASALGNLVFSIEYNAEGDVYVRAVSTQPVREPSLGLLLEFSWPRGKTFREFTVFLDPVQRLAKRPSDRTKTVLDASGGATVEPTTAAAPTAQPPQPAVPAPAVPASVAAASVAAIPPQPTAAAPVASVAPPPAPPPATASVAAVPPQTVIAPAAPEPAPVAPVPADDAVSSATVPAPVSPASASTPAPPATTTSVAPQATGVAVAASDLARSPMPTPTPLTPPPGEVKPAPAKAYKGGDFYGPVAAGEGLWKIALKVRLDPEITAEQMMQALFRANPHAFAKSGIDGLKVGSTLRVPTLREIAKFAGSATAKRLADAEDTAMAMLAETAKPSAEPTAAGTVDGPEAKTDGPIAFPLAPPEHLEPMVTAITPAEPALAVLAPQLAKLETVPGITAFGSTVEAMEAPVDGAADRVKAATAIEPSKAALEPAKTSAPIKPPVFESVAQPATAARAVSPPLLEPVAAAPLPFTAVSEVMASINKIPAFALPAQIAPAAIIADVPAPPVRKIPAISAVPPAAITRRIIRAPNGSGSDGTEKPAATTEQPPDPPEASGQASAAAQDPSGPKPSTVSLLSATDLLAAIEEPIRRVESVSVDLASYSAGETTERAPPSAAALAREIRQELLPSPSATTDENADDQNAEKIPAETVSSPAAEMPPAAVAAPIDETAAIPSVDTLEPAVEPRYQSGVQYGPIAPNERLWDIATKVRPDPSIGKDVMMKALHMANPQAFAKTGINQMKAGAMLRIPTLQEIADYTGSPAAKQLLEQQAKSTIPPPLEAKTSPESIPRTGADSMPVAESDAGSESGPEGEFKPSPQSAQPLADTPALSATPPAD